MEFSGTSLLVLFPYAALLGSTVDTCLASVYEASLASTLLITADSPQLQFIKGRRHPCLFAVAIPYGLVCPEKFPSCSSTRWPMSLSCWLYIAGYAGCEARRAVFVSLVLRLMMLGVMAGIDQKDSCSDMYSAGVAGDHAPRVVFLSRVLRPMMLGIMAGMFQIDSCSVMCKAGLLVQQWSFRSCSSSQVEQDVSPSWRSGRSLVQTVRRTFFFHRCSTRWPMSLLCRSSCFPGFVVKETVEISQLLGWIFWALYTGTGPGVVSTGTRPPQLGACAAMSFG